MATHVFPFRFAPLYRVLGLPFGVTPGTTSVEIREGDLIAKFGLWRVRTSLRNIAGTDITGPFALLKTAGPAHLSFTDRGLTMATNGDEALCIRFLEPVPGIEPTRSIRHPALTVTVAAPDRLAGALSTT